MTTLTKAHNQWVSRPRAESYSSKFAIHEAAVALRQASRETELLPLNTLRAIADNGEVQVMGPNKIPADLTHWSFGQLCARTNDGVPASYLRELPAALAAQCLNHSLARAPEVGTSLLLSGSKTDGVTVRAALSDRYERIWHSDITARVLDLPDSWVLPLAYDRDNMPAHAKLGVDTVELAKDPEQAPYLTRQGAYLSDRDMFLFMVDENRTIDVTGATLRRGFFIENSEVGSGSLVITTFLYDYTCGNMFVWGAKDVKEIRMRHVGDIAAKSEVAFTLQLREYANADTSQVKATVERARKVLIADTKDGVLDTLFGMRRPELTKARLLAAYEVAESTPRYGDPRSIWGMVNGLTEISQQSKHTDQRVAIDRAAGKLLDLAF